MSPLTIIWGLCAIAWFWGSLDSWWNGGGVHVPYLVLAGLHAIIALKCP
jgi:hypothetical protein